MRGCLVIVFVLLPALGSLSGPVRAEAGTPVAGAESDSSDAEQSGRIVALERSDQRFLPFAGRRVARIRITDLDVFGTSIDDTSRSTKSRLLTMLNELNFRTRSATIRSNLLFREGDRVDPFRIADSERILRRLPFISAARITMQERAGSAESVDVRIIVRESWSLMLSGKLTEGNGLKVGLTEQNLFGTGQQVSGTVISIPKAKRNVAVKYSVQNIRGSFVDGRVQYLDASGQKTTAFGISRALVSPVLEYAGALDLTRTSIRAADTLSSTADNASDLIDFWAGRPLHFGPRQDGGDRRRILFVSGRIRRFKFNKRPPVTPSTFHQYHNINHYLGSIALIRSRYYRTNLLLNFGRTEDIPYGFLVRFTYGLADEEFSRSSYAAVTMSAGQKLRSLGYGIGELRIGGNPRGGRVEEGVIRMRTLYFSNLLHPRGYRLRQFAGAEYVTGVHRLAGETIDLNGDEGIRGVVYGTGVTASRRLLFNLETVAFTPWKVWGTRIAFFTFSDLDFMAAGSRNILAQRPYSGLGLGIRLHKETLGIGPVQLRFAWYPRLPVGHASRSFTVFGEKRLQTIDFLGGGPEIVEY